MQMINICIKEVEKGEIWDFEHSHVNKKTVNS